MKALWRDLQHLTDTYKGERPLVDFLKAFFKQNHRLGSRDRRLISDAMFSWYRAAQGFPDVLSFEEKMRACIRLCGAEPKLSVLFEGEDFLPAMPFEERLSVAREGDFSLEELLPQTIVFSEGMDWKDWLFSILQQPRFFVRLRPGAPKKTLLSALQNAGISFEEVFPDCLSLPANTPLQTLWPQAAYTVQDWGSQQACSYLQPQKVEAWWDVCAGGGGKSLFLKDASPSIRLLSSDVRPGALRALEERFKSLGVKPPQTRVTDASDAAALASQMGAERFDAIVCDVPCSGSGTWAHAPEMRHFFREDSLKDLCALQTKIAQNSLRFLKPGGRFFYITCSVFREEDEMVVERLLSQNPHLRLEESVLQNGLPHKADSLFVAVFR